MFKVCAFRIIVQRKDVKGPSLLPNGKKWKCDHEFTIVKRFMKDVEQITAIF